MMAPNIITKRFAYLLKTILFSVLILFVYSVKAQSLLYNGTSSYSRIGNDASLHVTNFTLEAWIRIEGTGATTSSGTGGVTLVPIIAKGRAEMETPAVDVNYIFGYDLSTNKLVADFEDNAGSVNHPVTGNTVLGNCWTHVAASYNTTTNTWKLYVNGVLDKTLVLGASYTPQSLSNVEAAIGSSLNSTNLSEGFFNGRIDEVRIWNLVRTDAEITANYNAEVTSGAGLASRWGFNEGSGTTASNSVAGGPSAILVNSPTWTTGFNFNKALLDFNGTSDYVTFGAAPGLNTSTFTLESWIKIEGTGVTTVTSSAGGGGFEGVTAVVPIVTKGRGEGESPANINMNYFMGLVGNKLAADFEEAAGPNHSVIGTATIPLNIWTHVAATYDPVSAVWNLYINGALDKTLDLGSNIVPVSNSIQHAAVGTAMTSTGVAAGFFNGKIDEVRIWSVVRTSAELAASYNNELTSGTGLLGRWGFNEGCGLTANNSVSGGVNGTLSSSTGPVWVLSNFNSLPPNQPTNPLPANNGNAATTSPTLCATVSDPNGGNVTARFFGRKKTSAGGKFTVIGLPDTQFYTEEPQGANSGGGGNFGIFNSQTQWIATHRVDSNIAFVTHLGDCVQNGDNPPVADKEIEWKRVDVAMKFIENPNVPITNGIPYGLCVGNHDQQAIGDPDGATLYYNQYFGSTRFTGRSYYGGHYGTNNDNHYELFSAGGIDFINISIEYYPNGTTASLQPVLDWADNLLKTYSSRKGILSSHNLLSTGNPASFQGPGQKIYDDLKDNPNLILMLAGHVSGEGRRTDVFNGHTIQSIMADYQSGFTNGGNGYLRIMQFLPAQNLLSVKTYSPYDLSSRTSSSSQFTVPLDLSSPFTLIGTNANVVSGSSTCVQWTGLDQMSDYEWYVEVTDGETTITGPTWTFTTPAQGVLPVGLTQFDAQVENNNKVKLNWSTTYEKDNSHFEIERSKNGVDFQTIGKVAGINNTNSLQTYSMYDYQPLSGMSFYRLKQVDVDSRFSYSPVKSVNFTSKGFEIYPNPATGNNFTIKVPGNVNGIVEVKVFDLKGGLQFQKEFNSIDYINIHHHFTAGLYTVKITSGSISEVKKLMIY